MDFRILGPLEVLEDGYTLDLGGAKQRAALAVLALHANRMVAHERLIEALWDEEPPDTARKALQVYVSQLRKVLGRDRLETKPHGYLLRLAPDELDLTRFELLRDDGKPEQALALWRGDPLADFADQRFAQPEIARLEELRLSCLEQRIERDLADGRHAELVGELDGLARAHPLREHLRAQLMLALYRSGRQAEALGVYQSARVALVDGLGIEPGPELRELHQQVLTQDPALDLPAPKQAKRAEPPAAPPRPEAPATMAKSRKTVTVLFCDVVAYTELGERLDPESLQLVMSRYFEQAAAVLGHHGGTIEKFVGDEVMAVFGVPAVREDDALRAVRAAAALRESITSLEPVPASGAGLEVRIGINTGEVVAGDPAAGHGFVTGDAVSVGKRLELAAAPGEILLGEATYALVAHAVLASRLEPLKLRGKRSLVTAFRLESVDAEATAIPRRDDAPLAGRERELGQLRSLYTAVASGGGARLVSLLGEPGIGKSRLARELLAGVAAEATVLVGRCPAYGEGVTFWPLRELLRQAGRDEGVLAGSSHEVFAAVRRILEEFAAERPLVVVFDDVHWAAPTFLDLVEYLAGRLGDAPVLLLCLARPELAERRPNWLQAPARSLALEPLSEADSQRLLIALAVPAEVHPRIAAAAEGNPLFVEQLAAITDEHSVPGDMPGSIRGVLHERLDGLERSERSVLERAAIVGRSFSFEAVLDLTPPEERERVQAVLLALARKKFVRADTTAPEEGFRFHHALIRDAAYDGIPKATRADLHERVAARLEAHGAEDALVGYHLENAFGFRRELGNPDPELAARAGRMLRAAGRKAFGRGDLPATISLLERAGRLLPDDEAAQLLPKLAEALFEAGRFTEADDVLAEAIERAEADPLLESRARVEQQFVRFHAESGGAIGEAPRVVTAALRVFEEHGDDLGQCRAWRVHAWLEWNEGHSSQADRAWRRAATHARAAGEERELFEILGWRASAAAWGPAPVEEAIQTCTEIRKEVRSSPVAVAEMLHPLAVLCAMQGEFDEARLLIREANRILDDVGQMESAVSHHEAAVEMLAGDPAAAAERLQLGYERLEEIGEKALLATTAALLARATYAHANYGQAERFCSFSERTTASEDVWTQVMWRGVRAKILARQNRIDEAEAVAREAVRLVAQTDLLTHHGDALLDLAEVLQYGGRPADADAAVRAGLDLYARKGNVVSAGCARSLLATLAKT